MPKVVLVHILGEVGNFYKFCYAFIKVYVYLFLLKSVYI